MDFIDIINLNNPINKFWYKKYKKAISKNNVIVLEYLKSTLNDSINKKNIEYTPKYYACAKFIRATTIYKFKKTQIYIYYIDTFNDDFLDKFIVKNYSEFECVNTNMFKHKFENNKILNGGKKIGICKNKCCQFYKKKSSFIINWSNE